MDHILNTIAMLISVSGWVLCVALNKIPARRALEVMAVGEAIHLTVAVMTLRPTQIVASGAVFAALTAFWVREVRKAVKGGAA